MIQELIEVKKRNKYLKLIFFWDNVLGINKKWCLEFSELYRDQINLPFFAYSHPLCTDMEIMTALRKAGWVVTVMGIQSGSYSVRKSLYGRTETNEQVLEATKKLNQLKNIKSSKSYFRIFYDYIKNNPMEEKRELSESLDLFLKFQKGFIFQAFNLSFFPNYLVTKKFLENRCITDKDIEGNVDSTSASNWITTFNSKKKYSGFLRRHEYYYLLFSLAQFKSFSNKLIKLIERKKLFYNHLHVLYFICMTFRIIELTFRISNYRWLIDIFTMIPLKMKIKYKIFSRYN